MARTKRSEKDEARGARFRAVCQRLFPGQSRAAIAEKLGGVSGGSIRNWELGFSISPDVLTLLERLGVGMNYLLRGRGEPMPPSGETPEGTSAAPDMNDPKRLARIIGANLKHLRRRHFAGWGGQKKFADFLGISANDLCVYEYGRGIPNESRLAMIAKKLDLTPAELRSPLPDVKVPSPPPPPPPPAKRHPDADPALASRVDELNRTIARLEGMLEAAREQMDRQQEKILRLQEANYTLRHLLYVKDSPEAQARRERLLRKLEPAAGGPMKWDEDF